MEKRATKRVVRCERDNSHAQNRGFTLLEILVATAVLGTAVAALFGLLSTSMGNVQRLKAPSQALLLGQSRMNELLTAGLDIGNATAPIPLDQKVGGRWDGGFRWEALATRYSAPLNPTPGQLILARIAL